MQRQQGGDKCQTHDLQRQQGGDKVLLHKIYHILQISMRMEKQHCYLALMASCMIDI